MLAPGSVLQNRYRIEELIAEGGMGAVHRATDTRLNNVVALKECRIPFGTANLALRGKLQRQFEREARLLANLKHYALPKVIDYFTENNGQFLVMEYIEGDDLMEMIERGFPARAQRSRPAPRFAEAHKGTLFKHSDMLGFFSITSANTLL